MSYILDALRKSDQQRRRGATPATLTPPTTAAAPERPALSLNALFAAALVGAGILIGWLGPWRTDHPVPAPEPAALEQRGPRPAPAAPLPEAAGMAEMDKATLAPVRPSGTPAHAGTEASHAISGADAGVPGETATPMTDKPAASEPADTGPEQGVMALSELPPAIRREIPAMTISLHAYSSNPGDRYVMINDKLLRQGELLAPGLRLERITPDGVILGYMEYRFRRGVR